VFGRIAGRVAEGVIKIVVVGIGAAIAGARVRRSQAIAVWFATAPRV